MQDFINQLIQRNRVKLDACVNNSDEEAELEYSLTTLAIAQTSLNKLALGREDTGYPLQVVVIGPTQVGKSAVVNLLLQQQLAESSAQAGFTVHCQGFHVVDEVKNIYNRADHWAARYFGELSISKQSALDRQALEEYSLQEVSIPDSEFMDTVVWDTPDFDSVNSFDYRAPLLKAIALADLVVFVVSKEKYADKTVWKMLELVANRSIPSVLVMNKTPTGPRDELKASLEKKYLAAIPESSVPPITFIDEYPNDLIGAASGSELEALRQIALQQLKRRQPEQLKTDTLEYLRLHWPNWTSGLSAEHRMQREYQVMVELVVDSSLQRYKTEYLESDRHREVIQLALSELLVLLEVPGMAKPLSKIRSVVTWPVRTLISRASEPSPVAKDGRNEERRLLDELGKHTIASLGSSIAARESSADGPWWREVRSHLEQAERGINTKYDQSLDNYQTLLHVEIDRAAQSLYQNLQEQPATLNGLRAARVTADAAAVVLAVKSGGLGAVDLIVAPAMLSLTTLLTEGALGQYMQRIQKKLNAYQEKEVQSILDRKIRKPLIAIEQQMLDKNTSLSQDELQRMTKMLESGNV